MSQINAPRHFGSTTIALMFSFHRLLLFTVTLIIPNALKTNKNMIEQIRR